jgi:type VI secretion system secreted protein VgrG
LQACDQVGIIWVNAHVDWAAAKSISLSTAGGANITIEGGNITVQSSGKIAIHVAKKSSVGLALNPCPVPAMPQHVCVECLLKAHAVCAPFVIK